MAKKILRGVLATVAVSVFALIAAAAFFWWSFDQSAKPSHDIARAQGVAKKYGGIVLPPNASIVKAATREDFQGGQDAVIIARIPQQDVEEFARSSKIAAWAGEAADAPDEDCVGMTHDWEGYVVTNKNGGKCLLDHAFDGHSERKLALQPQPDGTALVYIAIANP